MNRLMKGKVPSGVYCPVCDSEMIYVNHSCNVHPFGLVCNRVELHDKIVNGVNFRGEIVVHFVSVDELRLKFSNVFGLFLAGGEILPFKVRRVNWADGSYFIVRKVVVGVLGSGGALCPEAFGCFINKRSRACDVKLSKLARANCYEWVKVDE
jgi:hypothetical protein